MPGGSRLTDDEQEGFHGKRMKEGGEGVNLLASLPSSPSVLADLYYVETDRSQLGAEAREWSHASNHRDNMQSTVVEDQRAI